MWGEGLTNWFELFAGIVVYRMTDKGPDNSEGWINVFEIEKRFTNEGLRFASKPYDPSNAKERNDLLEAIIHNAGLLCSVKLLERRRNINPPSLDYRVTKFGRKVDAWGYGPNPGVRKNVLFFVMESFFRLKKHWKLIGLGAAGWTVLNAYKFLATALEWVSNDLFAIVSAFITALVVWVGRLLTSPSGSTE